MKITLILLVVAVIGIIATEIALRVLLGFGKPLLYMADAQTGYRLQPNQTTRRMGNRIIINQYSMRGGAIAPVPAPDTYRILFLGDSIINGGWWTDQAKTLPVQVESSLQTYPLPRLEVLNASANSWGPRNELAYVAKFGTFGAQMIVLVINTDDLFATAPTSVQVGRDRGYPDHYPPFAWNEVLQRLSKPRPLPELSAVQAEGGDRVGANLEAIRQIHHLATAQNARLFVALTPLLREVTPPGPREYERKARQRFDQLMAETGIPYLDFLTHFEAMADPSTLYRDHIHLSEAGTALVSRMLAEGLQHVWASPSPQAHDTETAHTLEEDLWQ